MVTKKQSPADALKLVIETLDPLEANERQWVLQSAANLWTVSLPPGPAGTAGATAVPTLSAKPALGTLQDPKTFMKAKDPASETQRVACLAYFLANVRDVHAFKAAEIKELNTEAKGPAFNVPRAVANAANAKHGYLSSVGQGQKQITSHGEEVVEALPDPEKVKEIELQRRKPRRTESCATVVGLVNSESPDDLRLTWRWQAAEASRLKLA